MLAVEFTDTITLGTVIIGAIFVISGGVIALLKFTPTYWKDLAEQRNQQISDLQRQIGECQAELQNRPSLETLIRSHQETQKTAQDAFHARQSELLSALEMSRAESVEAVRAEITKSEERILKVLELIAKRLGKDPELLGG